MFGVKSLSPKPKVDLKHVICVSAPTVWLERTTWLLAVGLYIFRKIIADFHQSGNQVVFHIGLLYSFPRFLIDLFWRPGCSRQWCPHVCPIYVHWAARDRCVMAANGRRRSRWPPGTEAYRCTSTWRMPTGMSGKHEQYPVARTTAAKAQYKRKKHQRHQHQPIAKTTHPHILLPRLSWQLPHHYMS